jgi:peptidoglycan/xylan/chitin deacetylase (PgdA/CDA1 family)
MFHRFHKEGTRSLGQGSITDVEFEEILRYVGPERILSPRDWLARVKAGTLQSTDICITFDDGLRCQFEVALPVLNRLGLQSFWFIYSSVLNGRADRNEISNHLASCVFSSFEEFVESFEQHASLGGNWLSSKEYIEYSVRMKERFRFYSDVDVRFRYIRNFLLSRKKFEAIVDRMIKEAGLTVNEIASRLWMTSDDILSLHQGGHAIGLHSLSHPFMLASLPLSEQEAEYKTNHQHLSAITGSPPETMSHPLNSYSKETLGILHNLNIACGFCSNMSVSEGGTVANPSSLEFARVDSSELLKMAKLI